LHAKELAEAYTRQPSTVRFNLVTRALAPHLNGAPRKILDIGGGHAQQALLLARLGHTVTVVDSDSHMLRLARNQVELEPEAVQRSISLVEGDGQEPLLLDDATFDMVLCHSVIMYEPDPVPLIHALARYTRPNGIVSILSVNPDALAMRMALQGQWHDAVLTLMGFETDSTTLATCNHSREVVCELLEGMGVSVEEWFGVGVFTDHLTAAIKVENPNDVFEAEWQAGTRDPYRSVARCYHLLGRRRL
jgi:S-adenosylmethionine-dependent methyltransferase